MTRRQGYWLAGGLAAIAILSMAKTLVAKAADYIASFEGFSAAPYWDVSRYSWGYGTAAPGPTGSITKEDAKKAMWSHIQSDLNTLKPKINYPLSNSQWVALLSFSYNLGPGNAAKLVPYINSKSWDQLADYWNDFVYSGGKINSNLVDRRAKEWELFSLDLPT